MIPIMKQASVADLRNKFRRISSWIEEGQTVEILKCWNSRGPGHEHPASCHCAAFGGSRVSFLRRPPAEDRRRRGTRRLPQV